MKCEICDKEFGSYRSLNGHMRMHGTSNGTSRKKRKIHDRKYKGYMGHGPDGKASALHAGDTRFNS
jgi:hypothetical protein